MSKLILKNRRCLRGRKKDKRRMIKLVGLATTKKTKTKKIKAKVTKVKSDIFSY